MAQTNEYLVELYNWIQSKDSSFIDRFTFGVVVPGGVAPEKAFETVA